MEKQIYKYLKKYYLNFNDKIYKKLLYCKTDNDIYTTFQKIWKNEHGGLFRIDEPFTPHEILPYYHNNRYVITDTGSNSIDFHKKYI